MGERAGRHLVPESVPAGRQVGLHAAQRSRLGGAVEHGVGERGHVQHVHLVEGRRHRAAQRRHQPVVGAGAAGVDHHHPTGRQVLARQVEELPGRQVEGDIRLSVSVHHDHVVAVVGGPGGQPVAGVLHRHVGVGLVEVEVAAAGRNDVGVDLDARDVDRVAEGRAVLAGAGATRQAQDQHPPRHRFGGRLRPEGGSDHYVIPGPAGGQRARVVDGVDGLALVEQQLGLGAHLDDLDVLVGRFLLVEQRALLGRLHGRRHEDAGQHHHQRQGRVPAPARHRPETQHRGHEERQAEAHQRGPGAVGGNEPEDRQESAQDGAGRAQGVDGAGGVAAGLHVAQQEAYGKRRDTAEQHHRHREQGKHRQQRAQDQSGVQRLKALLRH